MSLCLESTDNPRISLFSKCFFGGHSPGCEFPRTLLHLVCGNCLLVRVYLHSGFPPAGTPRPRPNLSVCTWRKSVSKSASGTCWRVLAQEQISCFCLSVADSSHRPFFSTTPGRINTLFPFSRGSISWLQD